MKTHLILQVAAMTFLAPLVSGVISKLKNDLRLRKGQSVFQPYFNLIKLRGKQEVLPGSASWIFRVAPFAVFASSLGALSLVPCAVPGADSVGDCLALIFVLALGRFALALAALDTGSPFGGMGSSREMFVSSFAEPAACMAFFAASLPVKTTVISAMGSTWPVSLSAAGACIALFLTALAETSRVPVDNQETHLELTMIHEAMVLEYSGPRLALIELASAMKQMVWFGLIAHLVFPSLTENAASLYGCAGSLGVFTLKIACLALAVAYVETAVAKMRLFRVPDFLGFAFVTGCLSAAAALTGN